MYLRKEGGKGEEKKGREKRKRRRERKRRRKTLPNQNWAKWVLR